MLNSLPVTSYIRLVRGKQGVCLALSTANAILHGIACREFARPCPANELNPGPKSDMHMGMAHFFQARQPRQAEQAGQAGQARQTEQAGQAGHWHRPWDREVNTRQPTPEEERPLTLPEASLQAFKQMRMKMRQIVRRNCAESPLPHPGPW